ncbi:MAG: hypothetical protein AVDCRST_MAG43-2174 [uncultured Thermomicrobiales bacterium]|uniref:Uncharacterized protein n=1 Tax=uncultured Thermomicrobiales bacterium TaxID=1645740 RepID=A0A6J4UZ78_9BACT|nr:MAG: hypothetical protein AVDCRST_MAG43-2174 [uncultured Thermomicrobiales bacterium]
MTMESNTSDAANGSAASLGITSDLLDILVCPVDHGKLEVGAGSLTCTICQRTFTVEDGIPDMVVDVSTEGER